MGYNIGVLNLAFKKLEIEYNLQENISVYKGIYYKSTVINLNIF